MGQHPSKDKIARSASARYPEREKIGSGNFAKRGSAKKQREVLRVTQVLTAAKLSPKPNNRNASEAAKKIPATLSSDVKANNKKNIFATKEKAKDVIAKECGRTTVKGGRVSPGTRPPQQPQIQQQQQQQQQQISHLKSAPPRTAEALAVLVQHLVFNLEAFRVPSLKKELTRMHLDAEEVRLNCQQLEIQLSEEKLKHAATLELERNRFQTDVTTLIDQHRNTIARLKAQQLEAEQRAQRDTQDAKVAFSKLHEEQLQSLKVEFNRLQKTHAESLDILREENDAIREQIDEKNAAIEKLRHYKFESEKLRRDYEAKELIYKEQLQVANEEIARLKDENETFVQYSLANGDSSIQEVQSLRAVLDLKQLEVAELRKTLAEAVQKADLLQIAEEKIGSLTARCEDLQSQLERKTSYETALLQEKKKLDDSLKEEVNQKKRLKQHNEELQWKLHQNKEVMNRVLEQAEESAFNRTMLSASFNERHSSSTSIRPSLERTHSFREKHLQTPSPKLKTSSYDYFDTDENSPPNSPKVKGVVEKSDSVSYVLELDESPDVVAQRIVRRSFRNSTPPKSTPTKSPANKRPRMKNNPLSLSASASAIIPGNQIKSDNNSSMRSRSISVRNGSDFENYSDIFVWEMQATTSSPMVDDDDDEDDGHRGGCKLDDNLDLDEEHDVDINLPPLPSEIGRNEEVESLPVPRHVAGEAMVSESNSDDEESTTSSSSGRL